MGLFKTEHVHKIKNKPLVVPQDATFKGIEIEVHGLENFSKREKKKMLEAVRIGEIVLNSAEFKTKVCSFEFAENRGMSGLDIWRLICTGKDLYNSKEDNDIDMFTTMYHSFWTSTVGYTYPNTWKTWINRKYYANFSPAEVLGNVIHEAMHNFGFDHLDSRTMNDSVPYKIGNIVRDLAKEVIAGKELTPILMAG